MSAEPVPGNPPAAARTLAVSGVFLTQPLTGVQRYAWELSAALAASGRGRWRILLVAPDRTGAGLNQPLPPGADVILDRTRLPSPLWVQFRLPALVRRLGSPLLWSPANTGPLSVANQIVTIFDAAVFARPDAFSFAFRSYYRWLLPRLAQRAARVVTISDFSRLELERHGVAAAERIDVVPCGVSKAFHPAADSSPWQARRPYVLAVGSREPRKNLATLLSAWSLLARGAAARGLARGLRLLVAGGRSRAFAREAAGATPPGVELLGAVPDGALPGLYAAAEALVFPSLYEGFGLPLLEAMACGTPVLASRASSLPEVCGDAALYCDPLDARGMAQRIEALLVDAGLRSRLRAAGLQRAALFTWEQAARWMMNVLEAVSPSP